MTLHSYSTTGGDTSQDQDPTAPVARAVAAVSGAPGAAEGQGVAGVPGATTFREAIDAKIRAVSQTLEQSAGHLLAASGKGYRPLCLRLVGEAFSPHDRAGESHDALALAIEFVHVGSLIHDDILDEAETRRGVPSVHVRWNQKVAVLAGDFLLARASQTVAELHDPYLTARLAETITDLCEGELLQDEQTRRLDVGIEQYLERIAKKTASPFELACEGGARLSGADKRQSAVARRFGFHIGRLFQLVDDLLDWVADAQTVGKPVGQDLECGVITLPVLVALEHPETGAALRRALTPFPSELTSEVRALVTHPAPFSQAVRDVREEAERARRWLAEFPAGPARDRLEDTLEALVGRLSLETLGGTPA